jgi:hypothetical protein
LSRSIFTPILHGCSFFIGTWHSTLALSFTKLMMVTRDQQVQLGESEPKQLFIQMIWCASINIYLFTLIKIKWKGGWFTEEIDAWLAALRVSVF